MVAIAEGYEWTEQRAAQLPAPATDPPGEAPPRTSFVWSERWLLVRSLTHARAAATALHARLTKAQAALTTLAERSGTRSHSTLPTLKAVQQQAEAILAQYRVAEVLQATGTTQVPVQTVPAWDGRPATVCDPHAPPVVTLAVTIDEVALEQAVRRLGWRVYVTNQPATQRSLAQAVLAYRDEDLVERSLGRLKGRPLSLTPMYLRRDDHATGLVRVLSIGLRVLTVLEYTVRRRLAPARPPSPSSPAGADSSPGVAGLYPGAPTRITRRPTAERLLAAFDGLTLTVLHLPNALVRHLAPLSSVQHQFLTLLNCPPDTYTRLTTPGTYPQPP